MLARLGAPVTDPQGNSARNTSTSPTSGRVRAVISDVSCHTVGYRSSTKRPGTSTLPTRATRERSLRSRSTIIRFSARSFGLARSCSPCRRSSSGVVPRAAVPFIGRVRSRSPSQSKKSSGLALAITWRPRSR